MREYFCSKLHRMIQPHHALQPPSPRTLPPVFIHSRTVYDLHRWRARALEGGHLLHDRHHCLLADMLRRKIEPRGIKAAKSKRRDQQARDVCNEVNELAGVLVLLRLVRQRCDRTIVPVLIVLLKEVRVLAKCLYRRRRRPGSGCSRRSSSGPAASRRRRCCPISGSRQPRLPAAVYRDPS